MDVQNQVCSLILAQKLKILGVTQKSIFHWRKHLTEGGQCFIMYTLATELDDDSFHTFFSAFTSAELGEILKGNGSTFYSTIDNVWKCSVPNFIHDKLPKFEFYEETEAKTEADARAKMLVYLLENKLITL